MMKKLIIATISFCLAASLTAAPLVALAEEAPATPEYPDVISDILPFNELTDYAVASQNLLAFADGEEIIVLDSMIKSVFDAGATVTALDCVGKSFYYTVEGDQTVYQLTESEGNFSKQPFERGHNFSAPSEFLRDATLISGYIYYFNEDSGKLTAVDKSNDQTHTLDVTQAKYYGGTLYAISDNTLSIIDGYKVDTKSASELLIFSNYNKLEKVLTGNTVDSLQSLESSPQLVIIPESTKMTEIDIDGLATGGSKAQYFPVIAPEDNHGDISGMALLLTQAGNVAVVSIENKCYILNNSLTKSGLTKVNPEMAKAAMNAPEWAYTRPFMSKVTKSFELALNEEVTVLEKYSGEETPLAHDYYLIENADGEKGYVAAEYLTPLNDSGIIESDGNTHTTNDPNPTTDDYVRVVILVIIVIALALTAVGYLTWVGTSGKLKRKNPDGTIDLNQPSESDPTDTDNKK